MASKILEVWINLLSHPPASQERAMKISTIGATALLICSGLFGEGPWLHAARPPALDGVPVRMLVTVSALHGNNPPELQLEDVRVFQNNEPMKVISWTPAKDGHAGLDLYILIDDSSDTNFGTFIPDIRAFILAQPDSTRIAIGYMAHGSVQLVQDLTTEHALAVQKLRLPLGDPGVVASPYLALDNMIQRLPSDSNRHEIVMISSGIDRYRGQGFGPYSPDANTAIDHAQRAGAIVHTIYVQGAGWLGRNFWAATEGQWNLTRISAEAGGASFAYTITNPVTLKPYLDQLQRALAHQYWLEFGVQPGASAGFQPVRLKTEVPNAELIGAGRVYVPLPK
jgi:hypothetical protein